MYCSPCRGPGAAAHPAQAQDHLREMLENSRVLSSYPIMVDLRRCMVLLYSLSPSHQVRHSWSRGRTHVETLELFQALQEVENRAERVSAQHLLATYVNAGALVGALSSRDNGIVYGRRGTGKTHALKYLAETEKRKGNFVVYIDMEQDLGSTEGLYSDPSLLVAERAARLLVDVLGIIHNKLIADAFSDEAPAVDRELGVRRDKPTEGKGWERSTLKE